MPVNSASETTNNGSSRKERNYHSGIPSPPNDSDGGQRNSFNGNDSDNETTTHATPRSKSERVTATYSPAQSEPDSPG